MAPNLTADIENPRPFGFRVAAYNPALPLVIDPAVLVYCGYIGGSDQEGGSRIAVDSAGNAYITGYTYSSEVTFPVLVGPDLAFNGGDLDAFLAKVKADGSGLIYLGYIGGDNADAGSSIAVDLSGNAYVTGDTDSTQTSFPVTVGPQLTYNGGRGDAFVARISTFVPILYHIHLPLILRQ
jgi:hypothetical protein